MTDRASGRLVWATGDDKVSGTLFGGTPVQFVSYVCLEDAFNDARVAPYVGRNVWFVLVPLFASVVLGLVAHYVSIRKSGPMQQGRLLLPPLL